MLRISDFSNLFELRGKILYHFCLISIEQTDRVWYNMNRVPYAVHGRQCAPAAHNSGEPHAKFNRMFFYIKD